MVRKFCVTCDAIVPMGHKHDTGRGSTRQWRVKRRRIFQTMGTRCVYCGEPATTIDHFVPVSKGGADDDSNLVPACDTCNKSKGSRLPGEFVARI